LGEKREEKKCKDLGISQVLTKFAKIPMSKSYIYIIRLFWEFWHDLTENPNGLVKLKKKIERWIH
jgi:hypothetical protein